MCSVCGKGVCRVGLGDVSNISDNIAIILFAGPCVACVLRSPFGSFVRTHRLCGAQALSPVT